VMNDDLELLELSTNEGGCMSRFFWPKYSPNLILAKVAASSTARSVGEDTPKRSSTAPRRPAASSGSTSIPQRSKKRGVSFRGSKDAPYSIKETSRFSTSWPHVTASTRSTASFSISDSLRSNSRTGRGASASARKDPWICAPTRDWNTRRPTS